MSAAWRAEAQQVYYPSAATVPAAGYTYAAAPTGYTYAAAPTGYTYAAAPSGYQYVQPAQYAASPAAAPYYEYQSGYDGVATQPAAAEAAAPAQPATAEAAPAAYGDPYGFTAWLNAVRAAYGLGMVGYDPNLAGWAAMNNAQQAALGLGHHVMGPARRQNSGMGDVASVESMWMASPAHLAALLDPTITSIGIAGAGMWWTFNAY
mgnify:CR=1 FL=1